MLFALLLNVAACGRNTAASSGTAPTAVPGSTEDEQKQLIMDNYELWAYTEPWDSPWFYTFTDFDHNGRLEVTAATVQGSGIYTWIRVYEVNADFSALTEITLSEEDGFSYPDMVTESMPVYFDEASGLYYYVCEDIMRDGAAHYFNVMMAFSLRDGKMEYQTLATQDTVYADPYNSTPTTTCRDSSGTLITEQEYDNIAERYFSGKQRSDLTLSWTQVENPWPEES